MKAPRGVNVQDKFNPFRILRILQPKRNQTQEDLQLPISSVRPNQTPSSTIKKAKHETKTKSKRTKSSVPTTLASCTDIILPLPLPLHFSLESRFPQTKTKRAHFSLFLTHAPLRFSLSTSNQPTKQIKQTNTIHHPLFINQERLKPATTKPSNCTPNLPRQNFPPSKGAKTMPARQKQNYGFFLPKDQL